MESKKLEPLDLDSKFKVMKASQTRQAMYVSM